MLQYTVDLHIADTHPAEPPFQYPWEDTGRGYGYGPGTGHWDLVHEILDVLPAAPEHAREQLLNDIHLQLPTGFLPGLYWMRKPSPIRHRSRHLRRRQREVLAHAGQSAALGCGGRRLPPANRQRPRPDGRVPERRPLQLGWFERERRAQPDGFLYLDIVNHKWESGVDQGIRFDDSGLASAHPGSTACVDATAHVYQEYMYAAKWARALGDRRHRRWSAAPPISAHFIQTQLWDPQNGFFYDSWVL